MFKKKKKPGEMLTQFESAQRTAKVLDEFFAEIGPIKLREGEKGHELIARLLGITPDAFQETHRVLRSIAAGRVIPRDVIARGE